MTTVVFAGPSIFGVDRSRFDRVQFRPPAACGDILRCIRDGATVIGLIDGYYGDQAAVWHKELLFALSRGIVVAGAASMGALRAAECATFGMLGFGITFAEYMSGRRTSDADVALSHAPEDMNFMPTSVALVDLEATLNSLRRELPEDERHRVMEAGRQLHFSDRTWHAIARKANISSDHLHMIMEHERSVKREDAVLLLEWLERQPTTVSRQKPNWQFQNTAFFERLSHSIQVDAT